MSKLKVTWIKSDISYADDQKRTIQSLGLRKLNQSVVHEDSVSLRGQIVKVRHLVKVEEVS